MLRPCSATNTDVGSVSPFPLHRRTHCAHSPKVSISLSSNPCRTSAPSVSFAAPLLLPRCPQNQWRHGLGHFGMFVNRHKRHIRRRRMLALSGHRILRINLHPHLHRSMKNAVDLRLQIHNLAQIHRVPKINVIHRRRHHIAVRVPVRRQRCSHVNKVHHPSAEKFPQRISHRRQNDFRHLRTRCADWLPGQLRLKPPPTSFFPLHSSSHSLSRRSSSPRTLCPLRLSVLILVFRCPPTADCQPSLSPSLAPV